LDGASGQVSLTNIGATKQPGEPDHAGNPGGKSVWFRWTAPASGTATITTGGSNFDTLLAAYTGTALTSLAGIAADDDAGATDRTSTIAFPATAGTTYLIAVD